MAATPIVDCHGPIAGQHTTGGDLGATTWGPATHRNPCEVSKLLLLPSHARQNKNIQEEIHLCVFSIPQHFFKNYEVILQFSNWSSVIEQPSTIDLEEVKKCGKYTMKIPRMNPGFNFCVRKMSYVFFSQKSGVTVIISRLQQQALSHYSHSG